MLNETNIFQKDKMDGKTLSAMINKKKRRARQKYEMEHKISSAWIKKLNAKGRAELSKELQVVLPLGKKPSKTIKKNFQNVIEALDENQKRMLKQKYQSYNTRQQRAILRNHDLGIDWIRKLDNNGKIKIARELIELQPAQKTIRWNHEVQRKVIRVLAAMDKDTRDQIKEKYQSHICA